MGSAGARPGASSPTLGPVGGPIPWPCDPTLASAAAQAAWTVTIERLIGDALSLLAEPQATELDRVQLAFDLLDKAEGLLGYGKRESGKGFEALLRAGQSVRAVAYRAAQRRDKIVVANRLKAVWRFPRDTRTMLGQPMLLGVGAHLAPQRVEQPLHLIAQPRSEIVG